MAWCWVLSTPRVAKLSRGLWVLQHDLGSGPKPGNSSLLQQIVTPIEDVEEAEEKREDAAAVFVDLARPDLVRLLEGAHHLRHVARLARLPKHEVGHKPRIVR